MDTLSQEITIILIGSAFFILVAIGIIVLLLIYQKRQLQYVMEKQELSNQFQKELLKARIETREETLNQISRELHDNIGQLLSSAKLLIAVAYRSLPSPKEELQLAEETISKAINDLRALSKSLNKEWLEKFNFIENLTSEVRRINSSKELVMTLAHPDEILLPSEHQLVLFRIVQETCQNSLKHGKASRIKIGVQQASARLEVQIEDNGKGFDVADTSRHGVGMLNIKNRTQLLGGKANWMSSGEGTLVTIQIPTQQ
jgi:signal transduction histidine kinase